MDDCIDHGRKGNSFGYALKFVNGKQQYMHRIAYAEKVGIEVTDIENGKVIRHKCDNPRCINPEHLIIGTRAENSRDMVGRGRQRKGSMVGCSVLTEEIVLAIKSSTGSNKDLSMRYGISAHYVSAIRRGTRWKHVSSEVVSHEVGNSCGENNGNSILTQEDATAILASVGTQRDVAKRFGVSQTTVWNIRNGVTWKEVR